MLTNNVDIVMLAVTGDGTRVGRVDKPPVREVQVPSIYLSPGGS